MDGLVFDVEIPLDVVAMPLSEIAYWYGRAADRVQARSKKRR